MKKSIFVLIAIMTTTIQMFALDISHETGREQSIKRDASMSVKNSNEHKNSNRKFNSSTNQKSFSADITFVPIPAYLQVADDCVSTLKVAADFGLSAMKNGMIDLQRKSFLESATGSAVGVSEIGGDEIGIKRHIACVLTNSAKMAQANINLESKLGGRSFSSNEVEKIAEEEFQSIRSLPDRSVSNQYNRAMNSLKKQSCRFVPGVSHETIQCGTLVYSFGDNSIKNAGVMLTGGEKMFGVSTSFRVSISESDLVGNERSAENSSLNSHDASMTKSKSNSMSRNQKASTSVAPFLPK